MQAPPHTDRHDNELSHTLSLGSARGEVDPRDLPFRTLTDNANVEEYVNETQAGEIIKPVRSAKGKTEDWKLVTFKIDDPENPKNWPKWKKWYVTMVVAFTCFVVAFASSVITADIEGPMEDLGVGREVSLVVVTVFVVGFGVGPMAFAPLSEMYGRRPVYAITLLLAVIFVIPCAVAQNIGTLIVCRTIDGIAFSAPMTLVGGTLADMWKNEERGVPMAAFSASPFLGPAIGPLAGGYLADATGWRWLYWLTLILAFVAWVLITFTVPETSAPQILKKRAKKLRKTENDPRYVTETELDARPFGERMRVFLLRPFQLLFLEPIVLFIALYMSVLYGLLYMFFVAYPIIYQGGKGWSAGSTGLMFIPLAIGVLMSAACSPFVNKHYLSLYKKYGGKPPAEARLIPMMLSCWLIPIGLFIFAWTSYPQLHWFGPAIGGWPVGFGFIFLYNSANNYLVDTYQHQAASALAAKTFLRSMWGASTVLFTEQMYDRLGDQWASSLLAFIALACCAIPFVFYFKGASIRRFSRFAFADDEEQANLKA
ncbi:major facilitator superfamily domain-containing protein [Aspergillus pseudoustus]|uniref:Major facilitator superfamily domain-containing protein n=1 Tax=Aspergillus pseudoustus TaxID=1810923 RepID=A0ABR4J143_9EURO